MLSQHCFSMTSPGMPKHDRSFNRDVNYPNYGNHNLPLRILLICNYSLSV